MSQIGTRELVDDLVQFLRDYEHEAIGELAQRYPSDQQSLWIDWGELYRFDPDIANDYRRDPQQFRRLLEEALGEYDLPIDVDLSGAAVRVRNLPETSTFGVGGYRSQHIGRYIGVRGQVTKTSDVKPRPQVLAWECQRCGTRHQIPQSGTELQEPHECQGCERQGPFEPDYEASEWENHQLVRVQQPPEETQGAQGATVDVHLTDDAVQTVQPGDRATINGVMSIEDPDQGETAFTPYIDGHAVEREDTDFEDLDIADHEDEIRAIANGDRGDPYELLVDSIAPKIQGMRDIKEAIALQLFGGVRVEYPDGTHDRGNSHILLMGDPGTAKSSLLRAVEDIAPRSTYASGKGASAAGMTAAAVRDDFGGTEWGLEAGALVLAHKGVACVDEIDKIDDEARSSLHDALESQRVEVNKAGINATMAAETALLAAGNPEDGRFDTMRPLPEQIDLGPTLLSRFDLMFLVDDKPEEERDTEIAGGIIDSRRTAAAYTADSDVEDDALEDITPAIPRDRLRSYIAYARRNITPRIQDDAVADELRESFVDLRLANGEHDDQDDSPVPVTFRKLEGIMRLAEASARVRLSPTVEMQDIDRARRLIGRSMQDVGIDPDDGQLDADVIETGQSTSQRERRHKLVELIDELDGREAAAKSDIIDEALERGWGKQQTKYDLKKLKSKGKIYTTDNGDHWRVS